ncbi:MAG: ATP-binding protein [Catenibacillus sp.]
MDKYLDKMIEKENLCASYVQKADELYRQNGKVHTKDEGIYIQRASDLRYEMAQISVGQERNVQQRRLLKLNQRMKEIMKTTDPQLYKKITESVPDNDKSEETARYLKQGPAETKSKSPSPGTDQREIPQETVARWFKEAPLHSFDDVSGMDELKRRLRDSAQNAPLEELRRYLKMELLHSYFFYGPMGCGKTYIIQAFAHELMKENYKYISLEGSDILSRYVGDAEKIVTRLFEEAEKNAPCIVFVDEIDGVCKNRSLPNLPTHASTITTAFLTGFNRIAASNKPIIFICATNYPGQVDGAILDRMEMVRVPLPDAAARCHALTQALSPMICCGDSLSFEMMAKATESYSYRDLKRLVNRIKNLVIPDVIEKYKDQSSAVAALESGGWHLEKDLFDRALRLCLPTPKDEINRELDEFESEVRIRTDA